jgi:hypothetical protein
MDDELGRMKEEAAIVWFQVQSLYLLGWTEERTNQNLVKTVTNIPVP